MRAGVGAEWDRSARRYYLRARPRSIRVVCNVQWRDCRIFHLLLSVLRNAHIWGRPSRGTRAVGIDVEKREAHGALDFAAMAGRPGQRRKSKIVDDFGAFLPARSGRRRGWATVTDECLRLGVRSRYSSSRVHVGCTTDRVPR